MTRLTWSFLLLLAGAGAAVHTQTAANVDPRADDDRRILLAVFEHLVPRTAGGFNPGAEGPGPASHVVIDRTAQRCETRSTADGSAVSPRSQPFCANLDGRAIDRLLNQPARGSRAGLAHVAEMPSPASREAMVLSFTVRNTESHALPLMPSYLVPLPSADPFVTGIRLSGMAGSHPPFPARVPGGRAGAYLVFSLPGYSPTDQAIVYAFRDCGGRCGTSYLFLLEKHADAWSILGAHVLGQY